MTRKQPRHVEKTVKLLVELTDWHNVKEARATLLTLGRLSAWLEEPAQIPLWVPEPF